MTIIQAIILGVVEGVTEFLPISSTGHMILASKVMGIADTDFLKSFEIIIQFGAILAVIVVYWKKLWQGGAEIWKRILIAFLPTAIIGFLLYKILKTYLLGNAILVMWSLLLGGILLIAFEWWYGKKISNSKLQVPNNNQAPITNKQAFLVGLAQSLAIIPGVSRSGATIIGGLAMNISREAIVEFSFFLAIPTMAAATGYDLLKSAHTFSFDQFHLLIVGFVVSFLVAMLSIKWFIGYVQNHSFVSFGIYRIVIAIVFYILIFQFKV